MEERLRGFFKNVGPLHALNINAEVSRYISLMKQYPQIAEQEIHRFKHYFMDAPAANHRYALECLIKIAKGVPQVRPRIIEHLGSILYEYYPFWRELPEYNLLNRLLEIIELPLSEKDQHFRNLSRSVVTLHKSLILVIGAGFSYDSMPITSELKPFLIRFLKGEGISSPMNIIQDNDKEVWRIVKGNSSRFKDVFSGWCARMHPAPQHTIVSRMLHDGQISHLISFNWDDLVERAYTDSFSEAISKIVKEGSIPERPSIWKLHGDVADLSGDWIFPYDEGRIFNSLIESLDRTIDKNPPEYALIVGYSEWEKVVKDRLIRWLEDNIPVVLRIRPNWEAEDPSGIPETSKRFFERLQIYNELESKTQ